MANTGSPLFLSIYNESSGSEVDFLNWRLDLDGPSGSSNMMIIDSFSGSVSGSITVIETNTIYEANGFVNLNLEYVISEETSPGIGETVEGKLLKFTPDVTNTAAPYIRIDGEYQAYPVLRRGFDGALNQVGVGKLFAGNTYLLRFEGGRYIEISSTTNYQPYFTGADGEIAGVSGSNPYSSGSNISRLERAYNGVFSGCMVTLNKYSGLGGRVTELVGGSGISLETTTSTSALVIRIGDQAIATSKLAPDSIGTNQYVDGSIESEHISASAITIEKRIDRERTFLLDMQYTALNFNSSGSGWVFPPDVLGTACGYFQTPNDFSENLSITPILLADTSGSTFYTGLCGYYGQSGSSITYYEKVISVSGSITAGCSLSLPVSSGCLVRVTFTRDGTSLLDTGGSSLYLFGVLVSYTADS